MEKQPLRGKAWLPNADGERRLFRLRRVLLKNVLSTEYVLLSMIIGFVLSQTFLIACILLLANEWWVF